MLFLGGSIEIYQWENTKQSKHRPHHQWAPFGLRNRGVFLQDITISQGRSQTPSRQQLPCRLLIWLQTSWRELFQQVLAMHRCWLTSMFLITAWREAWQMLGGGSAASNILGCTTTASQVCTERETKKEASILSPTDWRAKEGCCDSSTHCLFLVNFAYIPNHETLTMPPLKLAIHRGAHRYSVVCFPYIWRSPQGQLHRQEGHTLMWQASGLGLGFRFVLKSLLLL